MKKVLSVTLASAMAVVTLAGCGGGNSAQQTTASMEELSATIGTLADTANDLMKISEQLNMEVSFFKVR